MKIFTWIKENYLLVLTLFLLAFIPLYPKLPLLDVKHTWVYIRVEDFLVAVAWGVFFLSLLKKKVTIKTPLTIPILLFWAIGALATINGILFIFPKLSGVFPTIALLNFFRRVEYLSLFFLAFSAVKNKNAINAVVATLATTLTAVFVYGLGQRLWGFPAFLTMNEEFAKGIPLRLSALARIPSTFAGHYDLAAYLILLIPIIGSMVFGYKKWYLKIIFAAITLASLILLLMTASRVSYAVYLLSIALMLILQKQKKYIIPVFIVSILLLRSFTGISQRFAQTFTQVDLVVDSRTGKAIGVASEIGDDKQIVIEDKQSTGENLPTGSKYINIPSSGGKQYKSEIVYKKLKPNSNEQEIISKTGDVIVKKAFAYDVSFTTRFQGEWPRAIEAFQRNILLGSGYSSINLATDNSFLRMLGETGLLGFLSFALIFIFMTIYLFKMLPAVDDKRIRSLIYGVVAGSFGLALNATLIDVYEASKVAFVLWMIVGLTMGFAHLYQKKNSDVNYLDEMKRIFTSLPALIIGIAALGFFIFSKSLSNYFVGDDFTWLRWAADCSQLLKTGAVNTCGSLLPTITHYFTSADNFFFRPGTKTYFFLAYPVFELFPSPFHVVSIMLHLSATILVFFLTRKFIHHTVISFVAAVFFMVLSVNAEALYWISVTGHLIATNLLLISFLSFMYWKEKGYKVLFILSLVSILVATFFHEFGFIGALLLIAYDVLIDWKTLKTKLLEKWYYLLILFPVLIYYVMRTSAKSVWFQGDYSYNIAKLPLNVIGNAAGYFITTLLGPFVLPYYAALRTFTASQLVLSALCSIIIIGVSLFVIARVRNRLSRETITMLLISAILFIVPLLPFLGLGNLSPRYAYMSTIGVVLLLAYIIKKVIGNKKNNMVRVLVITLASLLFIFMHVKQLEKINNDWKKAGDITNNMLVGLNYAYGKQNALPKNSVFYFINTPIKYGDAWVFPVGLADAVWFAFQNNTIQVRTDVPEDQAREQAKYDRRVKVFKFDKDGSISELSIPLPTPTPIDYGTKK